MNQTSEAPISEDQVLPGCQQADSRDRGDGHYLTEGEQAVAEDLAGEQHPHGQGRHENFDDAGLLLLHHALGDDLPEGEGRHEEQQAEAERDEVDEERVLPRLPEQLNRRRQAHDVDDIAGGRVEAVDLEASRRLGVFDDCGIHLAVDDECGGLVDAADLGDVERLRCLGVLGRAADSGHRGRLAVAADDVADDDGPEHEKHEHDRRDDEGLAAQSHANLALSDQPGGGCCGWAGVRHLMTSLKMVASEGCEGVKRCTDDCASAVFSTRWAVAGESTSKSA